MYPEGLDYRALAARERAKAMRELASAAAGGLRRVSRSVVGALARWHKRRATIAELSALDDRMLKDIGVSRGNIPALADGLMRARAASTDPAGKVIRQSPAGPSHRPAANDDRPTIAA
jgi:uncharacterized protein YjiS (DUF1127 family)